MLADKSNKIEKMYCSIAPTNQYLLNAYLQVEIDKLDQWTNFYYYIYLMLHNIVTGLSEVQLLKHLKN